MATFLVTDPQTGQSLRLTGDSPPTEQELEQIFASASQSQQAQAQQVVDPDVPTPENLALSAQNLVPAQPSIGERIGGGLETAATVASGALAEPIAGLAGIGAALNPFAEPGAGARRVEQVREALTLQPATQSGQAGIGAVGETLGAVVEPVQEFTQRGSQQAFEATGSPAVGAAFETLPVIAGSIVGRFLSSPNKARTQTGNKIQRELSQQSIDRLGPNSAVKKAVTQGFDEKIAVVAKNSSSPTKKKIAEMVKVVKRGLNDPLFRQETRASDIVGDSLVKRFEAVNAIKKEAGQQLEVVAKKLKGETSNFNPAVSNFLKELSGEGVTIGPDLKPNFRGVESTFQGSPGSQTLIKGVLERISDVSRSGRGNDAFVGHKFKKFLDEQVSFGKASQSGATNRAENLVKGLRSGVNEALRADFPAYGKANAKFKEAIDSIDVIQNAAGKKIDFTGPNADKAGGVALRSLTNNTQKRANLLTALGELEDVAGKHGKQFGDDIATQVLMVNELERVFPNIVGQTGLQATVGKGVEAIAGGRQGIAGAGVGALRRGIENRLGINEKNALKSIQDLLRSQR